MVVETKLTSHHDLTVADWAAKMKELGDSYCRMILGERSNGSSHFYIGVVFGVEMALRLMEEVVDAED